MDWTIIAQGLRFPEGPVAMPDGSVILVEIEAGRIIRIGDDGIRETVAEPGGGPNGLAIGPDGKLYCCNNGGFEWVEEGGLLMPRGTPDDYTGGRIERIDIGSGTVETLYTESATAPLRGPNDLVFDAHGGFWFTDHGKTRERSRDITGVFYARADGSECREVIFPMENPNGIGLSPDGTTLFVAETFTCKLRAFEIVEPGVVAPSHGPGGHSSFVYSPGGFAWFDSLGVEADGNVCVATIGQGGISVVAPSGDLVEFVATDDPFTTNICWGGEDRRTAWVTLSGTGRLARATWPRAGLMPAH